MKKTLLTICCVLVANFVFANSTKQLTRFEMSLKEPHMAIDSPTTPSTPSTPVAVPNNGLSGLGEYNFGGGNTGFSSPQGEVNYGFNYQLTSLGYFQFLPSISTPVNAALSKNYLPALMLPGSASVSINTFFPILGNHVVISPINIGLKFMGGFSDSAKTIIQHNIRTGLTLQIDKLISLAGQYTWAWHNSTDDSERNFNYVFNKNNSGIQYWTLTLQGRVSAADAKNPSYLIIQWRNLVNPGQFTGLQNSRIFTIGFKADMNLSTNVPAYEIK